MSAPDVAALVAEIKNRLDVPGAARLCGLSLPDKPGKRFPSPLRKDDHPSCELWLGRGGELLFVDRASGLRLDSIGFFAAAHGIENRAAVRQLIQHFGLNDGEKVAAVDAPARLPRPLPRRLRHEAPRAEDKRPNLARLALTVPDAAQCACVARQRSLSLEGVTLAARRGLLCVGRSCGFRAWHVLDSSGWCAQARRWDGLPFPAVPDGPAARKAHTAAGSWQAWPLGIREAAAFPVLLLVEGAPDLLAAHALIVREGREHDTAAVAMLGATQKIPAEALKLFRGKRVRLLPHIDRAGLAAMITWGKQLRAARAAKPDAYDLDGLTQANGRPVDDLNDLLRMTPRALDALGSLIPAAPVAGVTSNPSPR